MVIASSTVVSGQPGDLGRDADGDPRVGVQAIEEIRDIPAAASGPRIARVTWLPREARYSAACPAELAPPMTVTGCASQARASSSVAA